MTTPWHILGAGAMGCLFASKLQLAGCNCTLVVKNTDSRATKRSSETAISIKTASQVSQLELQVSVAADPAPISHLVITTKAYDVLTALNTISHRLQASSQILILVNGMGILEQLESRYPALTFYSGTTTEGAYRTSSREIVHAGTGTTRIGRSRQKTPPAWFSDWLGLAIECQWDRNIEAAMWKKLTLNCAINPLTAVHRCRNGELRSQQGLAGQLASLCEEIATVSGHAGQPLSAEKFHREVQQLIAATAANRSSMLQDIQAHRPTEIEYISGYLVKIAQQLGVESPINEQLLDGVRRIESSYPT